MWCIGFQRIQNQGITILGGNPNRKLKPLLFVVFILPSVTQIKTSVFIFCSADLVLKDKIFVYDLVGQRIGWANYDCKSHPFKLK